MKKLIPVYALLVIAFCSCKKQNETVPVKDEILTPVTNFTKYTIFKGKQYCDLSTFTQVEYEELKFEVIFDSTAIYQTLDPLNQADINKLYGFSDNNADHHEFSARIGWGWSHDSLRLYAYVYNNAIRSSLEICTINPGQTSNCSITARNTQYIFSVNGKTITMPRTSITSKASGYKLFPYFGGDEMAPHDIFIRIKEI